MSAPHHDPDCLFCKIVRGEIPSAKVWEDELCFAFRDIDPQAPVHFLVIPKCHIPAVSALSQQDAPLAGHLLSIIAQTARQEGLESYRVVSNIGPQAGQTVPHLHFHVLGGRDMTWPPG